jgi:hypothetical protein
VPESVIDIVNVAEFDGVAALVAPIDCAGVLEGDSNGVNVGDFVAGELAVGDWVVDCVADARCELDGLAVSSWEFDCVADPSCVLDGLDVDVDVGSCEIVEVGVDVANWDTVDVDVGVESWEVEGLADPVAL